MNLEFCKQILVNFSNTKFYEYPYSGSRGVPCGPIDGRTDITKLIIACRSFANAPKMLARPIFSTHFIQALSNECKLFFFFGRFRKREDIIQNFRLNQVVDFLELCEQLMYRCVVFLLFSLVITGNYI
jgi:hypothetical protein